MANPNIHLLPPEKKGSGAWNSRLIPYENDVAKWRSEHRNYREIALLLEETHGLKVSFSMVQKFVKARSKRRPYVMLAPSKPAQNEPLSAPAPVQPGRQKGSESSPRDVPKATKVRPVTVPTGGGQDSKISETLVETRPQKDKVSAPASVEQRSASASESALERLRGGTTSEPKKSSKGWGSLSAEAAENEAEAAQISAMGKSLIKDEAKPEGRVEDSQ